MVASSTGGDSEVPLTPSLAALRGGKLTDPVTQTLSIREPDARIASFVLLTSHEALTTTLIGPDEVPRSLERSPGGLGGILGDAVVWTHVAQDPAGDWTLHLEGPPEAAYLLVVIVESPLVVSLWGVPEGRVPAGRTVILRATADTLTGGAVVRDMEVSAVRYSSRPRMEEVAIPSGPGPDLVWTVPADGVYVLDVVVRGEAPGGAPFERTFVRSLLVGDDTQVCQPEPSSAR
jgi:hypothetical protein